MHLGLALSEYHGSNTGKCSLDLEEEFKQYRLAELELEFWK